jgi:hypothetical protein
MSTSIAIVIGAFIGILASLATEFTKHALLKSAKRKELLVNRRIQIYAKFVVMIVDYWWIMASLPDVIEGLVNLDSSEKALKAYQLRQKIQTFAHENIIFINPNVLRRFWYADTILHDWTARLKQDINAGKRSKQLELNSRKILDMYRDVTCNAISTDLKSKDFGILLINEVNDAIREGKRYCKNAYNKQKID